MTKRRHLALTLCAVSLLGCSFERRVEGQWKPDPGSVKAQDLIDRGAPAPLASTLVSGTFVAEDGIVELGMAHPDAALLKYRVKGDKDDCATVVLSDPSSESTEATDVRACLRTDDRLTVRHDDDGKPLEVTFRRVD